MITAEFSDNKSGTYDKTMIIILHQFIAPKARRQRECRHCLVNQSLNFE